MSWFPFCAKKIKLETKVKYELIIKEVEVDVGKTFIEVTFQDGRKVITCVIGEIYQYVDREKKIVGRHIVRNSNSVAKGKLAKFLFPGEIIEDNPNDIKMAWSGPRISAEILHTVPHVIKFDEHYVKECSYK